MAAQLSDLTTKLKFIPVTGAGSLESLTNSQSPKEKEHLSIREGFPLIYNILFVVYRRYSRQGTSHIVVLMSLILSLPKEAELIMLMRKTASQKQ